MIVILELILQFLGELALQLVAELFCEQATRWIRFIFDFQPRRPWIAFLGYVILGAVMGGLSLLVFPSLILDEPRARFANLGLTPITAGLVMCMVGIWREKRGQLRVRLDQFSYGWGFAFAMAAIRYAWGK